jgi:4-amino-4-deoxy-L-arabinose transferase-like glycosyltransferase
VVENRKKLDYVLLVAAAALTRFLFRSRLLYDLDSVNFALALDKFDPARHQPHPPGYFLYVCLGRLFYSIFPDANTALVTVSILASCASAAMVYALADCWFGQRAAQFAGVIFVVSPLAWFHGTVALTYIVEAFFAALIGYLCWQTYSERLAFLVPSAIALGVATGFRQSSVLFLGPLWLLSMRKASRGRLALGFLALIAAVLAWFLPMVRASGGAAAYFSALSDLWTASPAQQTAWSNFIYMTIARIFNMAFAYGLCFGVWVFAPLVLPDRQAPPPDGGRKLFLWVWVLPGLLFFSLVFFRHINSGYLLVLSPPLFAWLGRRTADAFARGRASSRGKALLLMGMVAVNAGLFLFPPFYCTYRAVREFEADLAVVLAGVARLTNPADSVIVAFDSHFLGYRHAGYYLPQYWTLQYPEAKYPSGRRVFALRGRTTYLLNRLPTGPETKFVIFPLPVGPREYSEYLKGVLDRFPSNTVRSQVEGGHEFVIGPAAGLRFLFPTLSLSDPGSGERLSVY